MLVLTISVDLYKLFQDRVLATMTSLSELCRIVVMAVDVALMLVVAILGAENGRANGACEMLDMIFAVECCDVGGSQGLTTSIAEKIEAPEVVGLAQRVLIGALVGDGEEL